MVAVVKQIWSFPKGLSYTELYINVSLDWVERVKAGISVLQLMMGKILMEGMCSPGSFYLRTGGWCEGMKCICIWLWFWSRKVSWTISPEDGKERSELESNECRWLLRLHFTINKIRKLSLSFEFVLQFITWPHGVDRLGIWNYTDCWWVIWWVSEWMTDGRMVGLLATVRLWNW